MLLGRTPGVRVVGRTARHTMFAPRPERQVCQLVMLALLTSGLAWVAHCADNGLLRRLLEVQLAVNLIDLRSSPSFDVASLARCASALS